MSATIARYEVGQHQASRGSVLWLPKNYRRDGTKRGVVYVHGAGELSFSMLGTTAKQAESQLLAQVAQTYPVIGFDAGVGGAGDTTTSDNWGNVQAQTELGNAITYLQAAAGGGAKAGKVILLGISMGHTLSLTYAQANAAKVQAIAGILPVNDLDDIRDNNRGGYRASISQAWGTAAWTAPSTPALPAAANPNKSANVTNIQAIPHRLWFASDDTICTAATVAAIVGLVPIITTVNLGAGDHSDASVGHVSAADLLAFLAANA